MNKTFLLFYLFFLGTISYSQEICNNAIDDDNDGLIDLNDSDCSCGQSVSVPSLIPNPSFEAYDYCPYEISQLDAAVTWIQATTPTTDYFNSCGYVNNAGMTPFPDGQGAVGAFFVEGWQEYLGACLLSPMVAGTNYQITFNIASKPADPYVELGNNGVITYGPINVTLYGTSDCNNMPLSTTGCPMSVSSQWFVLGTVNYIPNGNWSELTISFNPSVNVNAIILGSPCQLPPGYEWNIFSHAPYFYFDNLLLNETTYFNDVTIQSTGDFCNNNVVITSTITNPSPSHTFQWYLNGVAIIGATSSNYNIASYNPNDVYTLRVVDGTNCIISNSIQLNSIVPNPPIVTSPITLCQNDIALPLTATGNNLLWYTSAIGGTGSSAPPTPSTEIVGNFNYYVSQTCGLESPRQLINVIVNPLLIPNFPEINQVCYGETTPVLNSVSPNGIAGTWSPSVISSTQSDSYVFTPNSNVCAFQQTLNVSIIQPIEFSLNGGCINEIYIMEAIPNGNFNLNNITFQWFDSNGNSIGTNSPIINITNIVNSTAENEEFPLSYGLTITNNFGCSSSQTYEIEKVYCKIPKGISPNGDNKNDFFDLRGLQVTHLDIFNRFGMKVFEMDNYTTEWKGQSNNGDNLPDGTYYYYIEFNNNYPKTGWVYLQKNE